MSSSPKILSISLSDISHDARVLRQLKLLSELGEVTTVGYGEQPPFVKDHLSVPYELRSLPQTPRGVALLLARKFDAAEMEAPGFRYAEKLLAQKRFDLVVANEARALPLASRVAHGAPVWADMHEWAPEERSHVLAWKLLVAPFMEWICRQYLPQASLVTTVNHSIADLYDRAFGVSTHVLQNARPYADLEPSALVENAIRLVHSGAAIPDRGIENLIAATLQLGERYTLDLYLVRGRDQDRYWNRLKQLASGSSRITFHEAVAPEQLPNALNAYDIGVFTLRPETPNHRFMLPNKFFDFVQGRLALVFGPAPETDRLINEHQLGVIASGWSTNDVVKAVKSIDRESLRNFKLNTHRAARLLSSSQQERQLVELLAAQLPGQDGNR